MKITRDRIYAFARKVAEFAASNAVGTVVDTVVLWIFSHLVFKHYFGQVMISPLISFEFAVFSNFCCSYFITWKSRITEHTKKSFVRRFGVYNASCVGGFVIKMFFLVTIEKLLGWDVVFCNLAALCFSGVFNFAMGEFVIFRKRDKKAKDGITECGRGADAATRPEQ